MLIRCIDIESTGLNPAVDRVVEIATVDVHVYYPEEYNQPKDKLPTIERGEMWSSLVNPGIPIPPQASAIHDITDEMVKDAPMMADLYKRIDTGAPGAPDYYCAYNSRFDRQFVGVAPWIDAYRIALWLWPESPEHKLATLRYWLRLKLMSATDPAFMELVAPEIIRAHRALWDAYVCAAVLRRAFMEGTTIDDMVDVSSKPALLPRLPFGEHAGKPITEVPSSYLDWILSPNGIKDNEDVLRTAFCELQRRRMP